MDRQVISRSVESEFFTVEGLRKLTGFGSYDFPKVVVKELMDNALDEVECQEHGIIIVNLSSNCFQIWDNGKGIPEDLVKKLLDNGIRSSKKREYISPTRGKQGNALKTVIGIPCALKVDGDQLIIESFGKKHKISHKYFPDGTVDCSYSVEDSQIVNGTLITVNLERCLLSEFVEDMKLFNPHVSVISVKNEFLDFQNIQALLEKVELKNTLNFVKHRISDPIDIHWYSLEKFNALIWHYIKNLPQTKFKLFAGNDKDDNFLGLFYKLTNYRSQKKAIPNDLINIKVMGDFAMCEDKISILYNHLKAIVKPSKSSNLGNLENSLKLVNNHSFYQYTKKEKDFFIVEIFAIKSEKNDAHNKINWGINYSACYEPIKIKNEFYELNSTKNKIDEIINKLIKNKIHLSIHLICPNLEYLSYSKNEIDFSSEHLETLLQAFSDIKKKTLGNAELDEKEELKKLPFITVKDAIRIIAQDVYNRQSENSYFILTMRNFFYAVRAEIKQKFPEHFYNKTKRKMLAHWGDEDSHYDAFRQNIYELMDNELIDVPNLVSDPRGYLYEPHSKKEIKLGTKQIDDYVVSDIEYQGILYIEKENPLLQLTEAKIGQKYDILMCASKGYAVRAVKSLLKKCSQKDDFKIFCIHDADPDGYMIYQDLVNNLPEVQVIDLGLGIEQGLDMGISPETFTRKKSIPSSLTLSENEKKLFEENKLRIEISVMSPRDFINWVDSQLAKYLPEKKIPDNEIFIQELKPNLYDEFSRLITYHAEEIEKEIKNQILRELNQEIERVLKPFRQREKELLKPLNLENLEAVKNEFISGQVKKALDHNFSHDIKQELNLNPHQSWINTVEIILRKLMENKKQILINELKTQIYNHTGNSLNKK